MFHSQLIHVLLANINISQLNNEIPVSDTNQRAWLLLTTLTTFHSLAVTYTILNIYLIFTVRRLHIYDRAWLDHPHSDQHDPYCKTQT